MEMKAEIQSDVSAVLLELIHMEIVSHLSSLDHKECQVCQLVTSREVMYICTEQIGAVRKACRRYHGRADDT